MQTPDDAMVENSVTHVSVGLQLRSVREQRQMTIEQVARYMRLTESVIQAMESDAQPADMPLTYWRGYLRAYAKLLDLDIPELSATVVSQSHVTTDVGAAAPAISAIQSLQKLPSHYGKSTARKWLIKISVSVAVIALLVAGYAGLKTDLWRQWLMQPTQSDSRVTEALSDTAATHVVVPEVRGEIALSLPQDESQNSVATATDVVPENKMVSVPEASLPAKSDVTTATVTPSLPLKTVTENSSPAVDNVRKESERQPGAEILEFVFVEDCWVRVTDADGDVLAVGTKRQGQRFYVSGSAPIVVDLGNPLGVQLKHNYRPVDLSVYPGGRPAHITISPSTVE